MITLEEKDLSSLTLHHRFLIIRPCLRLVVGVVGQRSFSTNLSTTPLLLPFCKIGFQGSMSSVKCVLLINRILVSA